MERTDSHGLLPEEGAAVTGVGSVLETTGFRKEDAVIHRSTPPHSYGVLQAPETRRKNVFLSI